MKKLSTTLAAVALTIALNSTSPVSADPTFKNEARGSMGTTSANNSEVSQLLRDSETTYKQIVLNSPKGSIPANTLAKAKCIAVFPNIKTGAIAVGGSFGAGVAYCRNGASWSSPAVVDMTNVSIGAQIGGKATNAVYLFNTEKAAMALRSGKIGVGADASVAAGSYDASVTGLTSDVYAYQQSDGAYVGASFAAGNISAADKDNLALYGKPVTTSQILNGQEIAKPMFSSLNVLLPS